MGAHRILIATARGLLRATSTSATSTSATSTSATSTSATSTSATSMSGGWEVETALEGLRTQCLAVDPLRPEIIYCGTFGAGLFRSLDAGATWTPVPIGEQARQITAVAVSQGERVGDHGIVYAGTEPSAVYRSETRGATWRECSRLRALPSAPTWSFPPRPTTSHVRAIAPDPRWGGRVYAAIEAGALVRSFDGGQSWRDRVPGGPRDSHTLVVPARGPAGLVYAAAGDGLGQPSHGFARSRDAGQTWDYPADGPRYAYMWGLAVAPMRPDVLVISGAPSPRQAHDRASAESAIFRREGESAWEEVTEGLPPARGMLASVLAATETEPDAFYAANNTGLYRSGDTGHTWERLTIPGSEALASARPEALHVL